MYPHNLTFDLIRNIRCFIITKEVNSFLYFHKWVFAAWEFKIWNGFSLILALLHQTLILKRNCKDYRPKQFLMLVRRWEIWTFEYERIKKSLASMWSPEVLGQNLLMLCEIWTKLFYRPFKTSYFCHITAKCSYQTSIFKKGL